MDGEGLTVVRPTPVLRVCHVGATALGGAVLRASSLCRGNRLYATREIHPSEML